MLSLRHAIAVLAVTGCLAGCQVHLAVNPIGSDPADRTPQSSDEASPKRIAFSINDTPPRVDDAGPLVWRPRQSEPDSEITGHSIWDDLPFTTVSSTDDRLDEELAASDPPAAPALPALPAAPGQPYPIDLPTTLRLAGARSWNVQLAAERVVEARAGLGAAEALWLPSLVAGFVYTTHSGQLQATTGEVLDVRRTAFFAGGGARLGSAPLTGASGGPARMFVDLSLADAIFKPLVARQVLSGVEARQSATLNDTLFFATTAYYSLMQSQGRLVNVRTDLADAEALLKQTRAFIAAGKGSLADRARVAVDVERRRQAVVVAEAAVAIASAELARLLNLDPATTLFSLEKQAVPVELVDKEAMLADLVARAIARRPELAERDAALAAAGKQQQAERWRPLLPSLTLGISAGSFGGGVGTRIGSMNGRSDVDLLAVWEFSNLGFGTRSAQRQAASRQRQAELERLMARDIVVAEVAAAYHQVQASRRRIELAVESRKHALESLRLHRLRIQGLLGLPLEALQAVQAVARARDELLAAIIDYNRTQAGLLRAVGTPIVAE